VEQAPEPSTIVVQALASPVTDNATRSAARAIHGLRRREWARVMVVPVTIKRSDMDWTLPKLYAIRRPKTR
jgi:hypothetical protein